MVDLSAYLYPNVGLNRRELVDSIHPTYLICKFLKLHYEKIKNISIFTKNRGVSGKIKKKIRFIIYSKIVSQKRNTNDSPHKIQ